MGYRKERIKEKRKSSVIMIVQEKIQKKAEEYGELASVFLEGAKFALENQWINTNKYLLKQERSYICNNWNNHISTLAFCGYKWVNTRFFKDLPIRGLNIRCQFQNYQKNRRLNYEKEV